MKFKVDEKGHVIDLRVKVAIAPGIERRRMTHVHGIVVHQTGSSTASATLNSYMNPTNGAHFLIDKDGTIYQTASLFRQTWHVGKLRARCLAEQRCRPGEAADLAKMAPSARHTHEMRKSVPDRYPANQDSIGIELVGQAFPLNGSNSDRRTYEAVTAEQNASLAWLIKSLTDTLGIPMNEIFRHPVVSQKNVTEAASAKW
jgi:N-acetyl-anhydromuramyl-L-alanine amidase AmpD